MDERITELSTFVAQAVRERPELRHQPLPPRLDPAAESPLDGEAGPPRVARRPCLSSIKIESAFNDRASAIGRLADRLLVARSLDELVI